MSIEAGGRSFRSRIIRIETETPEEAHEAHEQEIQDCYSWLAERGHTEQSIAELSRAYTGVLSGPDWFFDKDNWELSLVDGYFQSLDPNPKPKTSLVIFSKRVSLSGRQAPPFMIERDKKIRENTLKQPSRVEQFLDRLTGTSSQSDSTPVAQPEVILYDLKRPSLSERGITTLATAMDLAEEIRFRS